MIDYVLNRMVLSIGIAILASVALPFIALRCSRAWHYGKFLGQRQYWKHHPEEKVSHGDRDC